MIIKNMQKLMDKHKISDESVAFHAGVTTRTVLTARQGKSVSRNTAARIESALNLLAK